MKTIDIAGIPFTDETIGALKNLIVPASEIDNPLVCSYVKSIDHTQSFLMRNWDELGEKTDPEMKCILTNLQLIKEHLTSLYPEMRVPE